MLGQVSEDALAEMTDGFSGAECVGICREACLLAMCEDPAAASMVTWEHFSTAVAKATKNITPEMVEFYDAFSKKHGH